MEKFPDEVNVAEHNGPLYLRFARDPVPAIFDLNYPFEIGKAFEVRDRTDATIKAIKDKLVESLVAAEQLAVKGLNVRLIDCHTLKPLDVEAVLQTGGETGAIVTAEYNTYYGALARAAAEAFAENHPIPMKSIGISDTSAGVRTISESDRQVRAFSQPYCQGFGRGAQKKILNVNQERINCNG